MANKEVIIYTSNTCGYCHQAKELFDSMGVSYTEKNVSVDEEAKKELIAKRFMGVPVILIDGETVQGFDREKIEELLNK